MSAPGLESRVAIVTGAGGGLGGGICSALASAGAAVAAVDVVHPDPEGYNRWVLDQQSLKHRGTPEDIGNLVAFLASDAASFITGQTIEIDGGWAMH